MVLFSFNMCYNSSINRRYTQMKSFNFISNIIATYEKNHKPLDFKTAPKNSIGAVPTPPPTSSKFFSS